MGPVEDCYEKCGMVTMRNPYQIYSFKHHHFKKYDKVDETVSIYATKNDEVVIANELCQHFVGGAHPNHHIPFT